MLQTRCVMGMNHPYTINSRGVEGFVVGWRVPAGNKGTLCMHHLVPGVCKAHAGDKQCHCSCTVP